MSSREQAWAAELETQRREDELARLIKRAVQAGGYGWCQTRPKSIARYLIAQGVTLPEPIEGDAS